MCKLRLTSRLWPVFKVCTVTSTFNRGHDGYHTAASISHGKCIYCAVYIVIQEMGISMGIQLMYASDGWHTVASVTHRVLVQKIDKFNVYLLFFLLFFYWTPWHGIVVSTIFHPLLFM